MSNQSKGAQAHSHAIGHVTGKAPYIANIVPRVDELQVGIVGSPCAHGRIVRLDVRRAAAAPGIVAVFTASDIPGAKQFGIPGPDEDILAQEKLLYHGQPVVVIAGESLKAVEAAKKLVELEVERYDPILTIRQAIGMEKFIGQERRISTGDAEVEAAYAAAEFRLSGIFKSGGQDHFSFETQSVIAIPEAFGFLTVYASTQNPNQIQQVIAKSLLKPISLVEVTCLLMGGAFGSKETQTAIPAILAALVAEKTGRSCRLIYGRELNMEITGKRHPFENRYKVGYDAQGRITTFDVQLFSEGGCSNDLSAAVMMKAMLTVCGAYWFRNVRVRGRVCFTNRPSFTAFRGFGGPQGMALVEHVMDTIAQKLGVDPLQVRLTNLCRGDDEHTHYGQLFTGNRLPIIAETLIASSKYAERRAEIIRRNATDRRFVHGISFVPLKFGISFVQKFLNQSHARVNVHTDGSVLVFSGGTEMGQGLYPKLEAIAAETLGVPIAMVTAGKTTTTMDPNCPPTAASSSTHLNGEAVVNACRKIIAGLRMYAAHELAEPQAGRGASPESVVFENGYVFDRRNPEKQIPWAQICNGAWFARVPLVADGFYATPEVDFNIDAGKGSPFLHFTQGGAVAEVKINRFTGALQVVRLDVLMDIGNSINPGIDRGQIIGGLVQGLGWVTTECLVYGDDGELLTNCPTLYKIPAVNDVPTEFFVDFLDVPNRPAVVAQSKAVGEPPFLAAIPIFSAALAAIGSRSASGARKLSIPATGEKVLFAMRDGVAVPDEFEVAETT